MKKTIIAASLTTAMTLFAAGANASDGTISFKGSIDGSTCNISINGANKDATVNLPKISSNLLGAKNQVAGATNFNLVLSNCSGDSESVLAFFEAGANVDSVSGNLNNNGTAKNVQVQLMDADGKVLKVGDTSQSAGKTVALVGGTATLTYAAQYFATDKVEAGDIDTSVTYSINYL
ncbi:fimbrial protein [Erwinia sp. AnSW2-5]|uniref:fimbrial protein n=1 Tax=Erwinia sp. AnSW2-5 TaxID=3367692 RepID=UPI003858FB72